MRIGHSQVGLQLGDFEGNLAKVVAGMERAEREHVEIVSFPECFLTGYPDTEELARRSFNVERSRIRAAVTEARNRECSSLMQAENSKAGSSPRTPKVVANRSQAVPGEQAGIVIVGPSNPQSVVAAE